MHELLWYDLVEKNTVIILFFIYCDYLKMTFSQLSLSIKSNCVSISREITEQFSSSLELDLFSLILQKKCWSCSEPFH